MSRIFKSLFPLSVLPRKIRRKFHTDILKSDWMTVDVLDFKMTIPIRVKGIGRTLATYGERELDQLWIIRDVLQSSDVVLDIGANIGYYSIVEARIIGDAGKIYAYEPDIRNTDALKRNIELNNLSGIMEVFHAAISDKTEAVDFFLADHANLNAMQKSNVGNAPELIERGVNKRNYFDTIKVDAFELCEVLNATPRPVNFIRMDLEGHESRILGALAQGLEDGKISDRAPRCIVYEPHSWEYGEPNGMVPVLERLMAHGYDITAMGSRHEPESPFHGLGYEPDSIHKEKRGMIRGVYKGFSPGDAVQLAACTDGVTTVCLQRL